MGGASEWGGFCLGPPGGNIYNKVAPASAISSDATAINTTQFTTDAHIAHRSLSVRGSNHSFNVSLYSSKKYSIIGVLSMHIGISLRYAGSRDRKRLLHGI